jgi:hypothetical protein
MKAFLVDPITKSIRELDTAADLDSIYTHLSDVRSKVETFQALGLDRGAVIFIDEEGRLKGPRSDLFYIQGHYFGQPCEWDVFGRGLIFGPADDDGEVTDAPFTLREVQTRVKWHI